MLRQGRGGVNVQVDASGYPRGSVLDRPILVHSSCTYSLCSQFMSTPTLVSDFYERVWNAGNQSAVGELLSETFVFRGSLGPEMKGQARFWDYVCEVRLALANYRCEILECVFEGQLAFAKMKFTGTHVGDFRGYRPSGLQVHWHGAALFRFELERICDLWVLGDLTGLDAILRLNAGEERKT